MKKVFVRDLLQGNPGSSQVELLCWIRGRRNLGKVTFLDLADSSGVIQGVLTKDSVSSNEVFASLRKIQVDSSVKIQGTLEREQDSVEIRISNIEVVGGVHRQISPRPNSNFNIFDDSVTDHVLSNRHFYIGNPKIAALLKLRHEVIFAFEQWFRQNQFIRIDAPVLTAIPLYNDSSVLSTEIDGQMVHLTQCVGFYLDAAAHVFEQVYNIGPSFRGEESRSLRHLMEYWHVKAEIAWASREDTILLTESLIKSVFEHCETSCSHIWNITGQSSYEEAVKCPYPRVSYIEALQRLNNKGFPLEFGHSLNDAAERELSQDFDTPFWIVGIPRSVEPFPYRVDPNDDLLTMTADLILPRGYGELLGVAEKIYLPNELDQRMFEKNKISDQRYLWIRELRDYGSVPRGAFGMGLERFLRWMSNTRHVRDCTAFPRIFRRRVYP